MIIHKEGYKSVITSTIIFLAINMMVIKNVAPVHLWLCILIFVITFIIVFAITAFFRIPKRRLTINDNQIISPADGKIVVIEEVMDEEYFKEKRLQVSVFMSPADVHVNRTPISGKVVYNKYHKGKYLVAWNPKSSTENERQSIVVKKEDKEILVKQIAGALARRIANYAYIGKPLDQNDEIGFIRFGSRVDLLLPLGTTINVKLNDVVQGGVSVIGTW